MTQTVTEHLFCVLMIKFWERIKLYLMPPKHQPDFSFLRHVPLRRVHLFTLVQIVCLAVLWILKSTFLAIIFPVMVRLTHNHPSVPLPACFSGFQGVSLIKIMRNVQDFLQKISSQEWINRLSLTLTEDSGPDGCEEAAWSDVFTTWPGLAGWHPAGQR